MSNAAARASAATVAASMRLLACAQAPSCTNISAASTWPAAAGEQHMQIHLEIRADDLLAAQEHALACGATLASVQPQDDVRVMFDPEGHPFCLWVEEAPGN